MPDYSRVVSFYNNYLTNNSLTIGLIAIPKCGSTTFRSRHGLNKWITHEEHNKIKNLICFIRDPKKRFLSSIVETIGRIYCPEIKQTLYPGVDVSVSREIFEFFNFSSLLTPKEYLKKYMDAIKKYGFFDDHNLPMYNCLVKDNNTFSNPLIFDVKSMNKVSKYLINSLDQKNSNHDLQVLNAKSVKSKRIILIKELFSLEKIFRHSKNIFIKPHMYKNFLKRIPYLIIPNLREKKEFNFDPILALSRLYPKTSFFSKREILEIFYKDIFVAANEISNELDIFLENYYSKDLLMYKKLCTFKKEISIQDIPDKIPKLKDVI